METRYCDKFRPVDEDAYLRDFIRAVEHKDLSYIKFIVPIIKDQQKEVCTSIDQCGHYLELSKEDSYKYDKVLSHGLLLSSHHGNLDITNYLLEQGALISYQNESGDTALIKACERGHTEVVKTLLAHGADINQTNLVGSSALQWVSRTHCDKRFETVKLLLSYDDIQVDLKSHKKSRTALHCAAESDETGVICKDLLDKLATVNIQDIEGMTPLHLAAFRGLDINVQLLIQYGAHINIQTHKFGLTALHIAMREGHFNTVKLLLVAGADLDIQDSCGQKALERMKTYAKLSNKYEYSLIEEYIAEYRDEIRTTESRRLENVASVLCELIPDIDKGYSLFQELLHSKGNDDIIDGHIASIPLRSSEVSLSVLSLHLLHVWMSKYKQTATFWILMRALRDHGMPSLADKIIDQFWREDF